MNALGLTPLQLLESSVYWCLRAELPDNIQIKTKFSAGCMNIMCDENDGMIVWKAMQKCFILGQLKVSKLVLRNHK
jgi:hypothetical protein